MANFKTHLVTGAVVGGCILLGCNLIDQSNRIEMKQMPAYDGGELLKQLLVGVAIGGLAGILPDLLEPADSPFHRKFWHSGLLSVALCRGMVKLGQSGLSEQTKACLQGGTAGYLSHLFLDSITPMGLPLV
jgi:membrane-bound metal-dependent hydrolase YbcI (DUF457 family)